MADLEIVERYPHSRPSTYVPVGLDATVNWGGADFKFRNNTDQPIAVVAWFNKPNVVFQVYGRSLGAGVSIRLTSTHEGYIEVDPPTYKENKNLKPGEELVIREEHIGQLATSYKVWYKDGKIIKKEALAKSRYRPISAIIERKLGPGTDTDADDRADSRTNTDHTGTDHTGRADHSGKANSGRANHGERLLRQSQPLR